jgi:hypothetical protein
VKREDIEALVFFSRASPSLPDKILVEYLLQ